MTPEPKDKLDAATTVVVNGPEDANLGWRQIDWRVCEASVRRMRQRIFTASQAGDLTEGPQPAEVDALLAREHAGQRAAGDGAQRRSFDGGRGRRGRADPRGQAEAGRQDPAEHRAVQSPARQTRVHPEAGQQHEAASARNSRDSDRCHQARVVNALEPEWEARFEPRSYGFRPGRGCHDAIEAIYLTAKGKNPKRRWVLDADLAGAFDRIAHDHILHMLGTFPARGMVKQWLKAGVVENGRLYRTEEGTPQGALCAAAHNPPYEQRWVMRSAGL